MIHIRVSSDGADPFLVRVKLNKKLVKRWDFGPDSAVQLNPFMGQLTKILGHTGPEIGQAQWEPVTLVMISDEDLGQHSPIQSLDYSFLSTPS